MDEDTYFEEESNTYDDFQVTGKKSAGGGKKHTISSPYTSKHIRERERKIENGSKKR